MSDEKVKWAMSFDRPSLLYKGEINAVHTYILRGRNAHIAGTKRVYMNGESESKDKIRNSKKCEVVAFHNHNNYYGFIEIQGGNP
jgi:hypothetical protein